MKFVNVDQSKALDNFVRDHSSALLNRISAKPQKYKMTMVIKPVARKSDASIRVFEVRGTLWIKGGNNLRAIKKDRDPQKAVVAVISALEKQCRRLTEKKERSRATVGKSLKSVRQMKWEISGNI